jgi:hypothetical protein
MIVKEKGGDKENSVKIFIQIYLEGKKIVYTFVVY